MTQKKIFELDHRYTRYQLWEIDDKFKWVLGNKLVRDNEIRNELNYKFNLIQPSLRGHNYRLTNTEFVNTKPEKYRYDLAFDFKDDAFFFEFNRETGETKYYNKYMSLINDCRKVMELESMDRMSNVYKRDVDPYKGDTELLRNNPIEGYFRLRRIKDDIGLIYYAETIKAHNITRFKFYDSNMIEILNFKKYDQLLELDSKQNPDEDHHQYMKSAGRY